MHHYLPVVPWDCLGVDCQRLRTFGSHFRPDGASLTLDTDGPIWSPAGRTRQAQRIQVRLGERRLGALGRLRHLNLSVVVLSKRDPSGEPSVC